MQRIERVNPNVSLILDDIDRLYTYLSEEPSKSLFPISFDYSFENLVDTFKNSTYYDWGINYSKKEYSPITPINNDNIILAFSGGKDSIASALKYREQGYNVYLYHMKHINPSFADEWKCAEESASILGMPIFFDDIKFFGHHMYMEHPMKNMIIANGALSYGVREGIATNIAFGNYTSSFLADNPFDRCAGDCMDMWNNYNSIIERVLPDFRIQANLANMGDTLDTLKDSPNLLNTSLSCLCRHSLRDYRRQWVKDKFGVELFQKRCGSCYKCCVEYIYMADNDKVPFNKEYYKYCLGQLCKVMQAEGLSSVRVSDIWDTYMFYDLNKSKMRDEILTTKVWKYKIRWRRETGAT